MGIGQEIMKTLIRAVSRSKRRGFAMCTRMGGFFLVTQTLIITAWGLTCLHLIIQQTPFITVISILSSIVPPSLYTYYYTLRCVLSMRDNILELEFIVSHSFTKKNKLCTSIITMLAQDFLYFHQNQQNISQRWELSWILHSLYPYHKYYY